MIKSANDYYYYEANGGEWLPDRWLHVIFTWKSGEGIRLYLNGCDMDPDGDKSYASNKPRLEVVSESYPIKVGAGMTAHPKYDGITDELYVWYEKWSPRQIWQFYLQGGTIIP